MRKSDRIYEIDVQKPISDRYFYTSEFKLTNSSLFVMYVTKLRVRC